MQVTLNSTSNDTFPLLWQIPGFNIGRRKRSTFYVDGAANDLFEDDDGDDVGVDDGGADGAAARIKGAFVLYAIADESAECRRKIACLFGAAARRRADEYYPVSPGMVGSFLRMAARMLGGGGGGGRGVAVLEEIADALARSRYDAQEDCSILECQRCFGV